MTKRFSLKNFFLVGKFKILLLHFIVFLFYYWTASAENTKPIRYFTREANSYSHFMADSLLQKRLELCINPSDALLNLKNPYDAKENAKIRLHDASLYNKKYYFYFSPLPAWIVVAPIKKFTGLYISQPFLIVLFSFVGYLLMFKFIHNIQNIVQTGSNENSLLIPLCLATATSVPWLLRRPEIYELCIASSFAFLMASYCCIQKLYLFSFKKRYLFSSGLFLAFAVFCRPSQCLAALSICIFVLFIKHRSPLTVQIKKCLFYFPLAIVGILMAIFNYNRFGSIFEFGLSYQLWGYDFLTPPVRPLALSYMPLGIYHYLFSTINFSPEFPFISALPPTYCPANLLGRYFHEPLMGIIGVPVLAFLFLFICNIKYYMKKNKHLALLVILLFGSGALTLCFDSTMLVVTMRYLVDFLPSFVLGSIAAFLIMQQDNSTSKNTLYQTKLIFTILSIISIFIAICLSFSGYFDHFKNTSPKQYKLLENFFNLKK